MRTQRKESTTDDYSTAPRGSAPSSHTASLQERLESVKTSNYQRTLRSKLPSSVQKQEKDIALCGQSANGKRIFYVEEDLLDLADKNNSNQPLVHDALVQFANVNMPKRDHAKSNSIEFSLRKNRETYTAKLGYTESGKITSLEILDGSNKCISSVALTLTSGPSTSAARDVAFIEPISSRLRNMHLKKDPAGPTVRLGRIGYPSRIRTVSDATIKLREDAQKLIWEAMDRFPWGSGNQILDIVASNGEAAIRHQMLYDDADAQEQLEVFKPDDLASIALNDIQENLLTLTDKDRLDAILRYAQYVVQYAGPNCDDMAAYTTALAVCEGLGKDKPIYLVEDDCHCFTLIGEPDDPESLVMCLWSGVPIVCTLEEFEFMPVDIIAKFPAKSEKAYTVPKRFDLHERVKDRLSSNDLPPLRIEGRAAKAGDATMTAQLLFQKESDRLKAKDGDDRSFDADPDQLFTHIWSTGTPDTTYISENYPQGKPINEVPQSVADKLTQKMARVVEEIDKRRSMLPALGCRHIDFQEMLVMPSTQKAKTASDPKFLMTRHRDEYKHVAVTGAEEHTPGPIDPDSGAVFYHEDHDATILNNKVEAAHWQYHEEAMALNTLLGGRVVETDVYEERLKGDYTQKEQEMQGLTGMQAYLGLHFDYGDADVKIATLGGKKKTTSAAIEREIGHQLVLRQKGRDGDMDGYIVLRKDTRGDWHSMGIGSESEHADTQFDSLASALETFSSEASVKQIECLYLTKDAQHLVLQERPLKEAQDTGAESMEDVQLTVRRRSSGFKRGYDVESDETGPAPRAKRVAKGADAMEIDDEPIPAATGKSGGRVLQSTSKSSAAQVKNIISVQARGKLTATTASPSTAAAAQESVYLPGVEKILRENADKSAVDIFEKLYPKPPLPLKSAKGQRQEYDTAMRARQKAIWNLGAFDRYLASLKPPVSAAEVRTDLPSFASYREKFTKSSFAGTDKRAAETGINALRDACFRLPARAALTALYADDVIADKPETMVRKINAIARLDEFLSIKEKTFDWLIQQGSLEFLERQRQVMALPENQTNSWLNSGLTSLRQHYCPHDFETDFMDWLENRKQHNDKLKTLDGETVKLYKATGGHIATYLIDNGISYDVFKQHLRNYDRDMEDTYAPGDNHAHDIRNLPNKFPMGTIIDYVKARLEEEETG